MTEPKAARPRHGSVPDRPLPPHVTTPLLTRLTQETLDEDYRHVAERRRRTGRPRSAGQGRALVLGAVLMIGLLGSAAAIHTSRNSDVAALGRSTLISRINTEKDRLADQQKQAGALREANAALATLHNEQGGRERQLHSEIVSTQASSGFGAVRGPGIVIELDDSDVDDNSLRDTDLALAVDGLWSVGAEAISINGHRLTAISAIRNSGSAILVNRSPLQPPYRISAIGDARTLEADWANTVQGEVVVELSKQYGFTLHLVQDDNLLLPGGQLRTLRFATPLSVGTGPGSKKNAKNERSTP